jgi:ketosteroid isomerase-like protein
MALMAGVNYIQFFLTDVESAVVGDVATVSCTENVLAAAADSPIEAFTGGKAVATNVFRRTSDGWRLWVHHASPVLSAPEVQQGETP